jgi:hypothetical protein
MSFAQIAGVRDDIGAGGPRLVSGPVARAIVHDEHARDERTYAAHHVADRRGFIVRGYQRDHGQYHARFLIMSAGRRMTDASASAHTLTAETIPIDRNGGYEDVMSVP